MEKSAILAMPNCLFTLLIFLSLFEKTTIFSPKAYVIKISSLFQNIDMFSNKVSSISLIVISHAIAVHAAWRRVCIFMRGDFVQLHPMTL
ncbi:hypothetical protein [Acinetobacter genomosp. 15BJ]|uniref:Uncharacterized protein n=1 Tax=Acinetobacter genomosp. 15BJ TaxID=106651 RepID=A0ABT8UZ03_9GAMM|nr:hypothetical protein [Acinetobacter genomosp. 15BJ]MCH7291676.1 hypothetical protein [Acinetobacter genomosp. 15BJ]MDO3658289.1 hypothetical protein [Acinetobacter genomosp. 15BJ]